MNSSYNHLDDVPHQIRQRLQGSPHPSHYSLVTESSPQPLTPHNQQVMSPNLTIATPQQQHQQTNPQQEQTPAAASTNIHIRHMQQLTQLEIPVDALEQIRQAVSFDISVIDDIRVAVQELWDRVQHRTNVLGDVTSGLHDGLQRMMSQLGQLTTTMQEHQRVIEAARADQVTEWEQVRSQLEGHAQNLANMRMEVNHSVNSSVQRDAQMATRIETLENKFAELEVHLQTFGQRSRETSNDIMQLRSELGRVYKLEDAVQRLEDSGSDTAENTVAKGMAEELAELRRKMSQVDDMKHVMEQLQHDVANSSSAAWMGTVQEELANIQQQLDEAKAHAEPQSSGPEVYQLSPNVVADGPHDVEEPWDITNEYAWGSWDDQVGTGWGVSAPSGAVAGQSWDTQAGNAWGISAPPGLPEAMKQEQPSAPVSVSATSEEIANSRWKLLMDIPQYEITSGSTSGAPWEIGMKFATWRRQVWTVTGTVSQKFQSFVEATFSEAEARHNRRSKGEQNPEIAPPPGYPAEYESRWIVALLRVIPDVVKNPAVEGSVDGRIRSVALLQELYHQVQPGGKEEQTSLTRFIRSLDPVSTAQEAVTVLRRWKLAKARVQALGLPEAAPFEMIKGLQTLVRNLERRHDSLRTRLALARLTPAVQLGQPTGVDVLVEAIEMEVRQLAADEVTRGHQNQGESVAAKGKGKGKGKGKDKGGDKSTIPCPFLKGPSGCKFGDRCHYKHPPKHEQAAPKPAPKPKAAVAGTSERRCRFFGRPGGCKLGDKCKFKHDSQANEAKALVGAETTAPTQGGPKPKASSITSISRGFAKMLRGEGTGESLPSLSEWTEAYSDDTEAETVSLMASTDSEEWHQQRSHFSNRSLWAADITSDEYLRWRSESVGSAYFRRVTGSYDVEWGLFLMLRETDPDQSFDGCPLNEEIEVLSASAVLVWNEDTAAYQEGFVYCVMHVPTGHERCMLMLQSDERPGFQRPRDTSVLTKPPPPRHEPSQAAGPKVHASPAPKRPPIFDAAGNYYRVQSDGSVIMHPPITPVVTKPPPPLPTHYQSEEHDLPAVKAKSKAAPIPKRTEIYQVTEAKASGPRANRAQTESYDDVREVLVDSGANEILRQAEILPSRAVPTTLTLADNTSISAVRTREGEVVVKGSGKEVILGLCRLAAIGCRFTWDEFGAVLRLPECCQWETVRLTIDNGLPYMPWEVFVKLRPALTRWYRSRGRACCAASGADGPEVCKVINFDDIQTTEMNITKMQSHGETMLDVERGEQLARELLEKGMGHITCQSVLRLIEDTNLQPQRVRRTGVMQGSEETHMNVWTFGMWTHGGNHGLTQMCRQRPALTQVLCALMRRLDPELIFSTLTITRNVAFKPHRDSHNLSGSENAAICLNSRRQCKGGELWIENKDGQCVRRIADAVEMSGNIHDVCRRLVKFSPKLYHGTESWEGTRTMLIAYAVPGSKSLQVQRADRDEALTLGFPLPDREGVGKAVQHQSSTHQTSQHNNSLHTQVPQNDDLIATSSQGLQGSSGETQGFQDDGDVSEGASRVLVGEVVDVPDGEAPVTDHPEGSSLTEPSADADLFDLVAYQQALEVLKKKCHAGCYDKDCEACVRARGAIRPHRSVSDGSKSYANLSLDISGPHVVSADKMKYIVIGVYRLPNGKNLYYAEPTKTKHASTVAEATVRIMAQLASLQVPPFFRLHTDCGKEFEAQLFKELGTRFSTFHTQSAPYNPQSNGRVERGVQALKQAAIRELVHSGLSPTYWTYAVQNAALYSRMRAMGIPVPKGTPKMGDWVAIKRPDAGDFEERANCGVFIGHNVSSVHGSWILCMVNGGLKMIRARLPVLLHQPAVRWKVSVDPDGDRRVWVGSNGRVVWGQDAPSGILTVEERLHGPEGNSGNLERIIKQRTWPRAAQESLELFTTFGHSILGAETLPEDIGPDPDSVEPETIVVDKLLADTAQANVIAAQPTAEEGKSGKYHIATFQEEQHAIEEEMQAILSGLDQASGITMTNDVFKTGTEAEIQKWVDAAKEELNNMDKLQVWTPSSWSTLRQDLGLKDTDEIPEIIPSKLVNVRKPVVMEEDIKKNAESAKQHAELNSWKARVRIVGCGNFEDTSAHTKEEYASCNIQCEGLRLMFSALANNPKWSGLIFDISCAFLYAKLRGEKAIVVRPAPILVSLGLVPEGTLWILNRALYGLRQSPVDWEAHRDEAITKLILDPAKDDEHGVMVFEPIPACKGLWKILERDTGVLLGIATTYVDDGWVIGDAETLRRTAIGMKSLWKVKLQGVLRHPSLSENAVAWDDMTCPVKSSLVYLGCQIQRLEDGTVQVTQRKWILQSLASRGYVHMNGTKSLPDPCEGTLPPEPRDEEYQKRVKQGQSEVGSLMWVGLRSRPDIMSTVGAAACLLVNNPTETLRLTKGLWRFLRHTVNRCMQYKPLKANNDVHIHTDASYANGGSRSRTGVTVSIGDGPDAHIIAYLSTRQALTAWSATEAELEGMASGLQQGWHVTMLLEQMLSRPFKSILHGDNSGAITLSTRETFSELVMRTRHFAIRTSWIRDTVVHEDIQVVHTGTNEIKGDILTKSLSYRKLESACELLGLGTWSQE